MTSIHKKKKVGQVIPFIQNGDYFYHKGMLSYRKKDMKKAIYYLEKAVEMTEENSVFRCQLAAVLADVGDFERSNAILLNIISHDETMNECYFFMANNYAHLGLFERAEEMAITYIEKSKYGEFYEDSLALLELLHFEQDEFGEEKGLDDEELLIIRHDHANVHLERGDYEQAVEQFQAIIAEHPKLWSAYNQLALALFMQGKKAEALKVTEEILENDGGNIIALCQLADFYYQLEETEKALTVARQIVKVIPVDLEQRFKVAQTLCKLEFYEESYEHLQWLKKFGFSERMDFLRCIGVAAFHIANQEKAERYWRIAIKIGDEQSATLLSHANYGSESVNIRYT